MDLLCWPVNFAHLTLAVFVVSLSLALVGLFVGLLIGAIGIGGVLLVPALDYLAGISVHEAVPACSLSYLATGAAGAYVFAKRGSIDWRQAVLVCAGAAPGALIGAVWLLSIPASSIKLLLAVLMIFAGIDAVKTKQKASASAAKVDSIFGLLLIGLITGIISAITGTGGPLVLIPILMFLGLPVLTAVGLSQAVQIPIAIFASAGNWMQNNLNIELGLTIAAAMVLGSLAGANLVHSLPLAPLKKAVAVLLIFIGGLLAWQTLSQFG